MLGTFLFNNQGKSSQVPQFLLEENIEPILCTQPRRFAVVAVANMVATNRNCITGGEVGYHIGHSKVMSARYSHYHIISLFTHFMLHAVVFCCEIVFIFI